MRGIRSSTTRMMISGERGGRIKDEPWNNCNMGQEDQGQDGGEAPGRDSENLTALGAGDLGLVQGARFQCSPKQWASNSAWHFGQVAAMGPPRVQFLPGSGRYSVRSQRLASMPGPSLAMLGGLLPPSKCQMRVLGSPMSSRTAGGTLASSPGPRLDLVAGSGPGGAVGEAQHLPGVGAGVGVVSVKDVLVDQHGRACLAGDHDLLGMLVVAEVGIAVVMKAQMGARHHLEGRHLGSEVLQVVEHPNQARAALLVAEDLRSPRLPVAVQLIPGWPGSERE